MFYSKFTIELRLKGKLWLKKIEKKELASAHNAWQVISTYYEAGKPVITILADYQPDDSFTEKTPTLEDVYFNLMFEQKIN